MREIRSKLQENCGEIGVWIDTFQLEGGKIHLLDYFISFCNTGECFEGVIHISSNKKKTKNDFVSLATTELVLPLEQSQKEDCR